MRLTTLIVATTMAYHAVAAPIPDPPIPIALPNVGGAVNDLSDAINFDGGIGNLERRDQLGETANDLVKGAVGTADRFVGGIGNLERRRGIPWPTLVKDVGNLWKSIAGRANGPLVLKKGNVKTTDGIGNVERRQFIGRFDNVFGLVKIPIRASNIERRLFGHRLTNILNRLKGKHTKKDNVKTTDATGNLERRDLFNDIVKGALGSSNPVSSIFGRATDNSKQTFVDSALDASLADLASAQASRKGAIEEHKKLWGLPVVPLTDTQAASALKGLWFDKLSAHISDNVEDLKAKSKGNARRSQDTLSAADVDVIKALASAKATEFKSSVEHLQKTAADLDTVSDPVDLSNIIVDTVDTAASAVANGGLLITLESLLTPGSAVGDLIWGVLNAIGSILGLPDVAPPGVVPSGVVPSGVVPPGIAPSGVSPPGTDSTLVDKIASNPQLLAAINEKVAGISA